MKPNFHRTPFLAMLLFCFLIVSARADKTVARPNIIFVLVDDLRWDALGCMGHPFVKTPNIDRIAKEGALFKNFFVSIPLCSPSRGSFLTGQYAHTHGILDNTDHSKASHELVTFPKLLHDSGYESAYIGKWHMGNDSSPRPGFDYWACLPGQGVYLNPRININGTITKTTGYVTDILNEKAVSFVKQKHDKPFVLYLSHKAVHGPFTPAERYKNMYAGQKSVLPPSVNDSLEGKPAVTRDDDKQSAKPNKRRKQQDNEGDSEPRFPEKSIHAQLEALMAVDEGVGQLFKALEDSGQLDNTLFIFSSDNGYFWGEHKMGDKRWAYEESIRDPLLMRYPKLIKAGTVLNQLVMNIDLAPTLLDVAKTTIPKNIQGKSLLPLFKKPKQAGRDYIFTEYFQEKNYPHMPSWQSIRTTTWKYIHYTELSGMDELYNLKNDPYELKNIINSTEAKGILPKLQTQLTKSIQ